eukprot:1156215-Pelagomonas_calceolata.AAC.6
MARASDASKWPALCGRSKVKSQAGAWSAPDEERLCCHLLRPASNPLSHPKVCTAAGRSLECSQAGRSLTGSTTASLGAALLGALLQRSLLCICSLDALRCNASTTSINPACCTVLLQAGAWSAPSCQQPHCLNKASDTTASLVYCVIMLPPPRQNLQC